MDTQSSWLPQLCKLNKKTEFEDLQGCDLFGSSNLFKKGSKTNDPGDAISELYLQHSATILIG